MQHSAPKNTWKTGRAFDLDKLQMSNEWETGEIDDLDMLQMSDEWGIGEVDNLDRLRSENEWKTGGTVDLALLQPANQWKTGGTVDLALLQPANQWKTGAAVDLGMLMKKLEKPIFHEIIWYEPDAPNEIYVEHLREIFSNVVTDRDSKKALNHIKNSKAYLQVIVSGIHGEDLVKSILEITNVSNICAFGGSINIQTQWAKTYPRVNCVGEDFNEIIRRIRENMNIVEFPFFYQLAYSGPEQLLAYRDIAAFELPALKTRKEYMMDFLDSVKKNLPKNSTYGVYTEKKSQDLLIEQKEYSMENILRWYANDPFIRKIINLDLNGASCKIQAPGMLFQDLRAAIDEQYKNQNTKFDGILYSKNFITERNWEELSELVGEEIEIKNFLTVSKNELPLVSFGDKNQELITTIIVPKCPFEWEISFAELQNFSDFPDEQEIVFNVFSRFRILEAKIDQNGCRQLVLLYDTQTLKKSMRSERPMILSKNIHQSLRCSSCFSDTPQNNIFYIHLKTNQKKCKKCLEKELSEIVHPFICISKLAIKKLKEIEDYSCLKIQGMLMEYSKSKRLPFYGYRCMSCDKKGLDYYYTCTKCPPRSRIFCEDCAVNSCFKKEHVLILENLPYTFWSEHMSEEEDYYLTQFKNYDHGVAGVHNEMMNDIEDIQEVIIKTSLEEIAKNFLTQIVWCGSHSNLEEKNECLEMFSRTNNIENFDDLDQAFTFLEKAESFIQVIASGGNLEPFIDKIQNIPNVSKIYIFTTDQKTQNKWKGRFKKVVSYDGSWEELQNKLNKNLKRDEFPVFSPIFDKEDKMDIFKQHDLLKGLTVFRDKYQAKSDFLALARKVYKSPQNIKDIEDFAKNYGESFMLSTLEWYTKQSFVFGLTNNCLRVGTFDSIQYARYFIDDLKSAVKERYMKHSREFNGILFRGAFISDEEFTCLENNIGRDIEMYGFLSTSRSLKVAEHFGAGNGRALIKIIVPPSSDKGEYGFADVQEFSVFQEEEETLFNIMSRFTILAANKEEIPGKKVPKKHLVLLYGKQELQSSLTKAKPLAFNFPKREMISCHFCSTTMSGSSNALLLRNMMLSNFYTCLKCLEKAIMYDNGPLLCLTTDMCNSSREVKGIPMRYNSILDIPFHGYKCSACGKRDLQEYFYTCLNCKSVKWCKPCFNVEKNTCLKQQHLVVLETQPFSFWTEIMSNDELFTHEASNLDIWSPANIFNQGKILHQNQKYEKEIEFYQGILASNKNFNNTQKAEAYTKIGKAYLALGHFNESINCHSIALDISREIDYESVRHLISTHPLVTAYYHLGKACFIAGRYEEAIENCKKSIEMMDKVSLKHSEPIKKPYDILIKLKKEAKKYETEINFILKFHNYESSHEKHEDLKDASKYEVDGRISYEKKNYEEAISHHSKALEIRKSSYKNENMEIATSHEYLGFAYYALGKYKEAIHNHEQALKIRTHLMGEEHSDTVVSSLKNLGMAYYGSKQYEKAIEFCMKSLRIKESLDLACRVDRYFADEKAIQFCVNSLQTRESLNLACRVDRYFVVDLYTCIGQALYELEKYEEAQLYLSKALNTPPSIFLSFDQSTKEDLEKLLSKLDQKVNKDNSNSKLSKITLDYEKLGSENYNSGKYQEAIENNFKALQIRKLTLGEGHLDIAASYESIGMAYNGLEKYNKTIEYCIKSLDIQKSVHGENHPSTENSYTLIGLGFWGLGEYKKAKEFLSKALTVVIANSGDKRKVTNLATLINEINKKL